MENKQNKKDIDGFEYADKLIEESKPKTFEENLVELMQMQQIANKNNLQLQIGNLIMSMLIFIFLIVLIVI